MKNITAIIKTFERPASVKRLVESIRRYYPDLRILVGDDSKEPQEVPGAELLALPHDIGLSAGRNRLVDAVETEYTLLLDDDFVFEPATRIELLLAALEAGFDLASGKVSGGEYHGLLMRAGETLHCLRDEKRRMHNGYPVYDMTWNFFLARTAALREVRWDEELKLAEHTDFFLRAMQRPLLVTHVPQVNVGHMQEHTPNYAKYRQRGIYYRIRFLQKHGLVRLVKFNGEERTILQYMDQYEQRRERLAEH